MIGGIIGAAAGAAGGILGGLAKNKALRKAKSNLAKELDYNQAWYDRHYNEDATQRADAQRVLNDAWERLKRTNRAAAGTAAVMGGTDESVAAVKEASARTAADISSQIAAAGAARKDSIENQYIDRKNELQGQINQLDAQKQSALDIAAGAIGGAANGFSKGLGWDTSLNDLKKA